MTQGRLYDTHVAVIRRASDGVERVYSTGSWSEGSWYWWTDGNASCDCNRQLFFEQAGGEEGDDDLKCGDGAYLVIRFDFPDGTSLDGPDAERFVIDRITPREAKLPEDWDGASVVWWSKGMTFQEFYDRFYSNQPRSTQK